MEHEGLLLNLTRGCKSDELMMNEQGLQIHEDLMHLFSTSVVCRWNLSKSFGVCYFEELL